MKDSLCSCFYKHWISVSNTTLSVVLSFLITLVIIVSGVLLNYRFRKKLQEEKRSKPLNRKGNVIESIMRWFCVIQILFWPYELLLIWISEHEIILFEWLSALPYPVCWISYNLMILGRIYVAFSSLFVALIRYVYIVHERKANQWEFAKVGKCFQIASVVVPSALVIVAHFVAMLRDEVIYSHDDTKDCVASIEGFNNTNSVHPPYSHGVSFTLQYVPETIVRPINYIVQTMVFVVYSNVIEAFLYGKIYQNIRR